MMYNNSNIPGPEEIHREGAKHVGPDVLKADHEEAQWIGEP